MSIPSYRSFEIFRIQALSQSLKFIARYDATENSINNCMHMYDTRSFIYLLTSDFEGDEYCIYVGQTKSQYARFIAHIKNFEFDHIYLFECNPDELSENEALTIGELKPLYNCKLNPMATRYQQIFNIEYKKPKTKSVIHEHLRLKKLYDCFGLYGFSLNPAVFSMLEKKAVENCCNCSEMLQLILEKYFPEDISNSLKTAQYVPDTNLATTIEYAKNHGCSRESIKQFLREKDRICGAKQIGRDWVLPRDAHFPEDRRKKFRGKTLSQ